MLIKGRHSSGNGQFAVELTDVYIGEDTVTFRFDDPNNLSFWLELVLTNEELEKSDLKALIPKQ